MTRVEIIAIVLRVAAIWLFLLGISALVMSLATSTPETRSLADAVMPLMILGFSVLTWAFATALARRILPESDAGALAVAWTKDDVETVTLRLLGINLLAWGVVGFAYSLVLDRLQTGEQWPAFARAQHVAELARNGALCVIGLGLVLGKARLRRIWERIRSQESEEPEPMEETDQT